MKMDSVDEIRRRLEAGEAVAYSVGPARWRAPADFREGGELRNRIRSGEFATDVVRRWRADIESIAGDTSDLLLSQSVIEGLRDIVARNPDLQVPNLLMERILRWYATSTLVLAHRDVDRGRRVVSLLRLLEDIERNASELSRAAYRRMHTGNDEIPAAAPDALGDDPERDDVIFFIEKAYDRLAGPDGQSLDRTVLRAEIAELDQAAEEVVKMRNTVLAHRSREGPALNAITVGTIHAYVDAVRKLVEKYLTVLLHESRRLMPVDQTNWKTILMFPWIKSDRERSFVVPYAATPDVVTKLFEALRPDERQAVRRALNEKEESETN